MSCLIRFVFLCLLFWIPNQARVLKISTLATPNFFTGTAEKPEGFLVDLLEDLKEKINGQSPENEKISYEYTLEPNGTYGMKGEDGKWRGLIGDVVDGRCDAAVAPLTISKERYAAVHFTHPFMSFSVVPLVKRPAAGEPMQFSSLKELKAKLESGNLTLGYRHIGHTGRYISNHKSPFVRSLHNYSVNVDTMEEGVRRVREEPNFAYYTDYTALLYHSLQQPCDVRIAWSGMLGEGYYGFAFPKTEAGRQLADKFSQGIIAAQQDGTVSTLFYRWWMQKSTCPSEKQCVCSSGQAARKLA